MQNKIKELREKIGITQEELSRITNTSNKTIYNIENNVTIPNLKTAYKIKKALGAKNVEEVFPDL